MSKDNGGPAFPATSWTKDGDFLGENQGMTMRDYFAAKALVGFLAEPLTSGMDSAAKVITQRYTDKGMDVALHYAEAAYMLADAMLAERSKE
jgi:hypothetical protein